MSPYVNRIALFLFGSGFCALVYQIAWLRQLRLVFGGSTAASATVVAIFMGGLGLGGYLLGKRSEKSSNPLDFYARLEIGISLLAALSVFFIAGVRSIYIALGGTEAMGTFLGTVVRLALTCLVLGIPTFLMGGTLPATVRAATGAADTGRRTLGLLYGINTIGAVAGAVVTTFVLIELLGIRQTVWLAAALNMLVAMAARGQARKQPMLEPDTGLVETGATTPPGLFRLVLMAAAVVGFVFFLMELVWYRMMGPILGGSTYTFGIVLAVALAGIGIGGYLYGRSETAKRPTVLAFVATCGLEALALAIPFWLGDWIAFAALAMRSFEAGGFAVLALAWTAVTALVVLPAAVVAGYQFPLLVGLLGSGRDRVASEVGLTYAWNTLGAIAGSIAGGFGLIPLLSAPQSWRLCVWILAATALLFLVYALRQGTGTGRAALSAATAVAAVLATLAPGPGALWRHGGVGAGRLQADPTSPNDIRALRNDFDRQVLWEVDGRESSVAALTSPSYSFIVNGKSDGSARSDAPTQVMSGLVGALLHPDPRNALVIGLGTGSSAGWLAEVDSIERVDAVELEPAILRVARDCAAVNRDVLDNPKVEIIIADAREFLPTTPRSYDVIFSEPSNPYRAGIASLFTREYYRAAAKRLDTHGLFLQWLQAYEVDAQAVRTAYATLRSVFPHVEAWAVHRGDLVLVASEDPIIHDVARVRERIRREPFQSAMGLVWGVEGAEGFYSGYLTAPRFASAIYELERDDVNTDDHPIIEFRFARRVGQHSLFSLRELARVASLRGDHRPPGVGDSLDWRLLEELRQSRALMFSGLLPTPDASDPESARRTSARLSYRQGDLMGAIHHWQQQSQPPRSPMDVALVAESAAEAGLEETLVHVRHLRRWTRAAADSVMARYHFRRDELAAATDSAERALSSYRTDPWPYPPLVQRFLRLLPELAQQSEDAAARFFDATAEPFVVTLFDGERMLLRSALSRHFGSSERCVVAFEAFEPYPRWQEGFLVARRDCYEATSHRLARRAQKDLESYRVVSGSKLWPGLLTEDALEPPRIETEAEAFGPAGEGGE